MNPEIYPSSTPNDLEINVLRDAIQNANDGIIGLEKSIEDKRATLGEGEEDTEEIAKMQNEVKELLKIIAKNQSDINEKLGINSRLKESPDEEL